MFEEIKRQARKAAEELCEAAKLREGQIVIIGCSTSEVGGKSIGSDSSPEMGKAIFQGIYEALSERGIYLAAQCCEHLNRAVITQRAAVPDGDIVNVVPHPKAGGSFATAAYHGLKDSVAAEGILADAGMDIGGTLIGMHLKKVAVPMKLSINRIGEAHVIFARTRRKFVGGQRAIYDSELY